MSLSRICAPLWGGLAAVVFLFGATAAPAETNRALLVEVTGYPTLPAQFHLNGPRYDVSMVRDLLVTLKVKPFQPQNITVLADGVDGSAGDPTRAAILKALADMAHAAQPGDFVYLQFSGHGSEQPEARPGTEPDGLDETFLPYDVGPWDDKTGTVQNALVDDEIGAALAAIRAKGAFVWAVFDSCHSGTITRGAPVAGEDEVRMRKVDPAALGIPDRALDAAMARGTGKIAPRSLADRPAAPAGNQPMGGFVVFSAAQSTETAPEMRLPAGKPGRVAHGLLTFTLFQVLAEHPDITYRRAGEELLQHYAANLLNQPTPVFEGDLDKTVFGGAGGDATAQWKLNKDLTIQAGLLQGLNVGDRLSVVPSPAAADSDALGDVEIKSAEALQSHVAWVEPKTAPDGAYVRRLSADVAYGLTVARPEIPKDAPAQSVRALKAALDNFAPADDSGLRVTWVDPGQPADLRLGYYLPIKSDRDRLWLLPSTGMFKEAGTPSIRVSGRDGPALSLLLSESLAPVARVANLLRLGTQLGPDSAPLDARVLRRRPAADRLEAIDGALHPGDEIHIEASNPNAKPVDLNVLYIGSDYSITHVLRERIEAKGRLNTGLVAVTDSSFGTERIVVIAIPAEPLSEIVDLSFLEQKALPMTRGGPVTGIVAQLREAGFGTTLRGGMPLAKKNGNSAGAISQFQFEVAPN